MLASARSIARRLVPALALVLAVGALAGPAQAQTNCYGSSYYESPDYYNSCNVPSSPSEDVSGYVPGYPAYPPYGAPYPTDLYYYQGPPFPPVADGTARSAGLYPGQYPDMSLTDPNQYPIAPAPGTPIYGYGQAYYGTNAPPGWVPPQSGAYVTTPSGSTTYQPNLVPPVTGR